MVDVVKPLPADQRSQAIGTISAKLPDDYLELTQQCEGLRIENCAILGLAEAYVIALPQASIYVLADCHGEGALGVQSESSDGVVYYLPYDDTAPLNAGTSFQQAVERRCLAGCRPGE